MLMANVSVREHWSFFWAGVVAVWTRQVEAYPDSQLVFLALNIDDLHLKVDSNSGRDFIRCKEDAVNEAHKQAALSSTAASNEEQLEGGDCFGMRAGHGWKVLQVVPRVCPKVQG